RPLLFIRATNDLVGQLARALASYCSEPFQYTTPTGQSVVVPLPEILDRLLASAGRPAGAPAEGVEDPARPPASGPTAVPRAEALRGALRTDPSLVGRLLAALSSRLPHGLVLVIDQGEEVITLARTEKDATNRRLALETLRRAVAVPGDFKII